LGLGLLYLRMLQRSRDAVPTVEDGCMNLSNRWRRAGALIATAAVLGAASLVIRPAGRAGAEPKIEIQREGSAIIKAAPGIAVAGDQIVTTSAGRLGIHQVGAGQAIVLRGVNLSGAEYACLTGRFWDDPKGGQSTIYHMRVEWHANVVRLPLNEGCWLGLGGRKGYRGAPYRRAMARFVKLATSSGLVVEVNLHFAVGRTSDDDPALDAAHAPSFWRSMAQTFKRNHAVIFDLINEPHGISWRCYRDGCPAGHGTRYKVVGTQAVVRTIRAAGATNPIIVAGLDWSDDLSRWPLWVPSDPAHQLIAGFHPYFGLGNRCEMHAPTCWNAEVASIQSSYGYPVIADEMGEVNDRCAGTRIETFMNWADAQSPPIGYWAWAFTVANCSTGPALISNASGNPTISYGERFKQHLRSVQ
jgi:endoglucanase